VADPPITRPGRVIGVDVARGVALFGMMAVHIYDALDDDAPTAAWVVAGGRSAATFVLIAGVSLAFMSGGRRVVHGSDRLAASAGLAVRALLIGAIGLVLGFWDTAGVDVILPYYGLMFLLAIPILTLPPRVLAVISAAFLVLGPVLLVLTARVGSVTPRHLTAVTLVTDPAGLLTQLVLTGFYPAVAYMTYLCVGIALGRLDLRSPRLAWWLFGGGIALAVSPPGSCPGCCWAPWAAWRTCWHGPIPRTPRQSCSGTPSRGRRGGTSRCRPRTRTHPSTLRTRWDRPWPCSAQPSCSRG
jgi:uncharacterized membrane protein